MATTATAQFKITYTSANQDLTEFHKAFDAALADVKSRLGQEYLLYINGEPVVSKNPPILDLMPADTGVVLGKFASASPEQVSAAVLEQPPPAPFGVQPVGGDLDRVPLAVPVHPVGKAVLDESRAALP